MKLGKATVGLCMLAALLVSAFAASGASAATGGTTGFTCKNTGTGPGFSDAHCLKTSSTGPFQHITIAAGTVTEAQLTNAKTASETTASTPAKLITKKAGVEVEITCNTVSGTGKGENLASVGTNKKMGIVGTLEVKYTACTVNKPAKCQVKEPIVANAKAETFDNGTGATEKGAKFLPATGETFTEITLENKGAEVCPLPGKFPVKGNAVGRPNGATTVFNVGEDELTFAGEKADLQGSVTIETRLNSTQAFTPLSITTQTE